MTGDSENALVAFTITKKDGSAFISDVEDQTGIFIYRQV